MLAKRPSSSPEGQLLPVALAATTLGCTELPEAPIRLTHLAGFHLFPAAAWKDPCRIQRLPAQPFLPHRCLQSSWPLG